MPNNDYCLTLTLGCCHDYSAVMVRVHHVSRYAGRRSAVRSISVQLLVIQVRVQPLAAAHSPTPLLSPQIPPLDSSIFHFVCSGRCYPCVLTVEVTCRCGTSVAMVPCGSEQATKPPKCRELCLYVRVGERPGLVVRGGVEVKGRCGRVERCGKLERYGIGWTA